MRLSEICIRRPVMTTLVMASLLLAGFFGYRQLPIAAIPRIEVPTITVTVQYPGASADTMAVSVAAPLERQFATIAGITSITSLNTEGNTQVTLEFDLNRNIDAASLDVQSAISVAAARLPEDLPNPPAYRRVNPADAPIIFLALTSDTAPSQDMNEFADKVMSPRLSTHHRRRPDQHPGCAEARGAHQVRPRRPGDARHIRRGHQAGGGGAVDRFARRQHPHQAAALHPGGQGCGADGRLLQAADRGVAQWRAGPAAGHRQCRGLRSRTTRRAPSSTASARSSFPSSASPMPTRLRSPTPSTKRFRSSSGCCRRPSSSAS